MFECQICGLLSLGGTACPACGSQLRKDLSLEDLGEEVLPTEVPGLDDAVAAWYDLEGMEPPVEQPEDEVVPAASASSLPFGFQGESTVYDSRLPFGIGSFADGIPFDSGQSTETVPASISPRVVEFSETAASPPAASAEVEAVRPPVAIDEQTASDEMTAPAAPTKPLPQPLPLAKKEPDALENEAPPLPATANVTPPVPVAPPPLPPSVPSAPQAPVLSAEPVRLTTARLVGSPDHHEPAVPDYWKIDAQIPDYEQIYEQDETVVEMEYSSLQDDVVVYDHSADSPAAVFYSPLESSPVSTPQPSIKLHLHPAQALRVEVGDEPPMQEALREGFAALQSNNWSSAARSFQKMAASMPTNAEVYNNYGIALLQRATAMRDGGDEQQKAMADTQFESSILALREAAKNAPTNGDILVNLAIALIESGRSEKALGIMNVHNSRDPHSPRGLNTAAVAMFELGQLTQAVQTLGGAGDDAVIRQNLMQLSPKPAHS